MDDELVIDGIDDRLMADLATMAAANGRTVEEAARAILTRAVMGDAPSSSPPGGAPPRP